MSKGLKVCRKCLTLPEQSGNTVKCPKCGRLVETFTDKYDVTDIWNNAFGIGPIVKSKPDTEQ